MLAKEATGWMQTRGRRGILVERNTETTAATPSLLKNLKSAAKTELKTDRSIDSGPKNGKLKLRADPHTC